MYLDSKLLHKALVKNIYVWVYIGNNYKKFGTPIWILFSYLNLILFYWGLNNIRIHRTEQENDSYQQHQRQPVVVLGHIFMLSSANLQIHNSTEQLQFVHTSSRSPW